MNAHAAGWAGAIVDQVVSGIPEPLTRNFAGWAGKQWIAWLLEQAGGIDGHGGAAELEQLRDILAGAQRSGGRGASTLSATARTLDHLTDQPPDPGTDLCSFQPWRTEYEALCAALQEVNYAFACRAEAEREFALWRGQAWMMGQHRWWYGERWAPHKSLSELCAALKPFCSLQLYAQLTSAAQALPVVQAPAMSTQAGRLPQMQPTSDRSAVAARACLRREPPLAQHIVQHTGDLVPRIEGLLESTRNIGIVGMGGIGKTTIARAVFENARRANKFDHFVWLNIGRDATDRAALFQRLQAATDELFSGMDVTSIDADGVLADLAVRLLMPEESTRDGRTRRVLLVLDDVWLTARCAVVAALNFATRPESRAEGSRLIVTTRNQATLSYHPGRTPFLRMTDLEVVEVRPLDAQPARQLFYHHAFAEHADAALEESAQEGNVHDVCIRLIEECGGNPLALRVTGAALRHYPRAQWEQRMEDLQARGIRGVDRAANLCAVSIDALPASLLECFVDFAAFPEDARVREADLVHLFAMHAPLHTPHIVRSAALKLQQLVQRSLVSVETGETKPEPEYYMHDILRSIAVREAAAKASGRCFYSGSDCKRSTTVRCFSLLAPAPLNGALLGSCVDKNKLQACIMSHVRPAPPGEHWPCMSRLRYLHCAALRNPEDTEGLFRICEEGGKMPQLNFASFRTCRDVDALVKVILPAAQLVHLDLSACTRLALLPESIGRCAMLAHLDLSRCRYLRRLPDSICNCSNLTRIKLNACLRFTHLPEGLGQCSLLAQLDLCAVKNIQTLPRSIGDCRELTHLDLCACSSLTELPQTIGGCPELAHLDISRAGIEELPVDFGLCTQLTHLSFSECRMTTLPEAILHLSQLVHLDLSESTYLTHLPDIVMPPDGRPPTGRWRELQNLDLSDCVSLEEFPSTTLGCCSNLVHLSLSGCKAMAQLPESVAGCGKLANLDLLECSSMEALPDGISCCTGLTRLRLGRCQQIAHLPDDLGLCHRLVELHLWYCDKLQELPGSICNCKQLALLNLCLCQDLRELPKDIGRCDKLVDVDMSHCGKVARLPDSIRCWSRLTDLNLGDCGGLVELPQGISACTALSRLCLDQCVRLKWKRLPSLAGCTKLRHLDLRDVQLQEPPEVPPRTRVRLLYDDDPQ